MTEYKYIHGISFPAIGINKWPQVFGIRNSNDLMLCTRRGVRKGYYSGLIILDSQCRMFTVQKTTIIGYAPLRYCLSMLAIGVRVKLEMSDPKDILLDEFKGLILDGMKKQQELWESGGSWGMHCNPIHKATTAQEITQYFCELYYKKYK